jgi:coiled-coil alpha-helical rod protein 1
LNERESNSIKLKQFDENSQQKIKDLEQKLVLQVETHSKQLGKCEQERETLANEQNTRIKQLINEKTKLCDEYQSELNDLRTRFEKFNSENLNSIEEKDEQIRKLTDENIKYLNELENLRRYVNDSMPTIETVKEMKKQHKQLEDDLAKSKSRYDLLANENSALQIRLKSISEILAIQEAQLENKSSSSNSGISPSSSGLTNNNEKKRFGLLGKWRNKVFELLVQLKTQEISYKQEKNLENRSIQDCLSKLDEQINRNRILENVIEDKKAEITVLSNDNTHLNEQVNALKDVNEKLEKKCEQDLQSTTELKSFIDSLLKQYQTIEDSFKLANRKLTHLDQRVEFAKNRLGVIQALYNRRESHLKEELRRANLLEMTTNLSSIHGSLGIQNHHHESNLNNPTSLDHQQIQHSSLDPNQFIKNQNFDTANLMKQELNKVVHERDMLAQKLKTDFEDMDDKIIKMKSDYESIIINLNNQLKDLKEDNDLKQTEINEANREVANKINLYDELNKKYNDLELEMKNLREKLNTECEAKLKTSELDYMDKLTKMDEKLNEARREQAKAVVMMRQMERSTNREKERMDNMLKSCETYYKDHIDKLKLKIISLEKEKNILMASLRQNNGSLQILPTTSSLNDLKQVDPTKSSSLKINKWLETNNLVELSTTTSNNSSSQSSLAKKLAAANNNEREKLMNNEVTSFWLDSKQNEEMEGNENYEQEEYEEEEVYLETSKNTEILNQIRKIMGNLELSDLDENENENNEDKLIGKYTLFFDN